MGQKVHPTGFRLGVIKGWKSRWFRRNEYQAFLEEDYYIRDYIERALPRASIERVEIKRPGNDIVVSIHSARPGLVIGRGGKGLEEIQKGLRRVVEKIVRRRKTAPRNIRIEIEEIRKPEIYARLVAKNIAEQIERRFPFRRTMKQTVEKVMQQKDVQGVRVVLSGRLGGAEIARTEQLSKGTIPLQTLRADVDYAHVDARTTYGAIGVKVWIYRGEVFNERDTVSREEL